jgi:hypothetical protein
MGMDIMKPEMKCFAALFLFLIQAIFFPAQASSRELSENESALLRVCVGVRELFQAYPNIVWPGYNLCEQPFIVYVPEKWALLFNPRQPHDNFSPYPEAWPDIGANVVYHPGPYKNLVGQLEFDFKIGSTRLLAIGFSEQSMASYENLEVEAFGYIAHEAFHQFQRGYFGEIPWAREERYPIHDCQNSALAYIEMRLLQDAIASTKGGDKELCRRRVEQFVAVRKYRWKCADPFVPQYEQGLELNEGTAEYVEKKCILLMKEIDYDSFLNKLAASLKNNFSSVSLPELLLSDFKARTADGFIRIEDMPRNRVYPLGSAQGFLLDYFGIDWKGLAQKGGSGFTFAQILQDGLSMDETGHDQLLEEAKTHYGYEAIHAATMKSIEAHLKGFRETLKSFESQPGYRIEVELVSKNLSRSRVSRKKKWIVDKGTRSLCNHFEVYTLKSKDLLFQLHNAGLLEENVWYRKCKKVVFYVNDVYSIVIDGEPVTSFDGEIKPFKRLEMLGKQFKLNYSKKGTILPTCNGYKVKLT